MLSVVGWKKAWVWIKHHWYFPVIAILLLAFFLKGEGIKNKYFDLFLSQRENYKKEIDLINKAKEEKKKKEEQQLNGTGGIVIVREKKKEN